jgi:hypothetical protein
MQRNISPELDCDVVKRYVCKIEEQYAADKQNKKELG